jgi:ketosteroid isomerase-like protein
MRRYHHLGIPTGLPRDGEYHLPEIKAHVYDYRNSSYGVEWMRFDPGAPSPDIVKRVPHVAFEVDDLEAELAGREVIIPPTSPSAGVTVAFIVENGAPIELLQYDRPGAGVEGGEHEVLGLERTALARWAEGDPGGFIDLAADDIVYFDPFLERRLDGKPAFVALMEKIRGTFRLDAFELTRPAVFDSHGLAVLTFDFRSRTGPDAHRWNATEVYRRDASVWRLVHQHWSIAKPAPEG